MAKGLVKKTKKSPSAPGAARGSRIPSRTAVASSSPLGLLALYLLKQWRSSSEGLVFLAGHQDRAERIGSIVHSLDHSADVMVYPRLDSLPFDGLDPSREIAGRRASVLRRLAEKKSPAFLISTAEAITERVPTPEASKRSVVHLKRGARYSEQDLEKRFEALGYDLEQEADYPGAVLFHGKTFEIFPAGALGPFRIEHDANAIEKIVAFDPGQHDALSEVEELLIDTMSEHLAFDSKGHRRTLLTDYCGRAHWIADSEVPARADSWLTTIDQAVGPKEAIREYMARAEWNKVLQQISLLPGKVAYQATPEFYKSATPGKDLRSVVADKRRTGARLLLVAAVEEDLRKLERVAALDAERSAVWDNAARGRSNIGAFLADFDAGFVVPGQRPLVVVTATDIFGSRARHPQPMAKAWSNALDESDVPKPGNIVVHLQKGLAQLGGLDVVETGQGPVREMVRLIFSGNDAVLLPPAELALIWPYSVDAGKLALDKADGSTWWERRGEAEREIQIAAKQLAKHRALQRRRQAASARCFASRRLFGKAAAMDEAGMSPLAGPVSAAAVILNPGTRIIGVDDSKKLDRAAREELAAEIKEKAASWCVTFVEVEEIDGINIYWAGIRAMQQAVQGLSSTPQHLLIDAKRLKEIDIPQQAIIKGDAKSASIAAASILAKVERDAVMRTLDALHPGYGFADHKGYPVRSTTLRLTGSAHARPIDGRSGPYERLSACRPCRLGPRRPSARPADPPPDRPSDGRHFRDRDFSRTTS